MNNILSGVSSEEFLLFLRGKFKHMIIHNSNVFFRDLHYGVMAFLESKGSKTGYNQAEGAARDLAARFVSEGIFTEVDHQAWRVNYPQFALPRVEKAPAPAPAAAGAPAKATAPAASNAAVPAPAAK
jgi:hypothetical protein